MKLVRLRIRNFRCFKDEIAFDFDDMTAIVGRNDAGKSTVMDTLAIFLNAVAPDKNDATKNGDGKDLTIICEFANLPSQVVIDDNVPTTFEAEYLLDAGGFLEIHKTYSGHTATPKCTSIAAYAIHPTAKGVSDLMQLKNPELKKRAKELDVDLNGIDQKVNAQLRQRIRDSVGGLELQPVMVLYAPTDLSTLIAKGYDYWALGHVHTREVVCEQPRIVFPGNLQGRHTNETGAKGCELVTVEAGRIEAEFVALDVVRWSQVSLSLNGIDRLDALSDVFHDTMEPLLIGTTDRLHAVRVTLTGSTALHRIEATQPGTLAAAVQAATQDVSEAEIWIEQVRLELSTPLDRAQAALRQDAVGELVRLVDSIAGDPAELMRRAQADLGDLFDAMPQEVAAGDVPKLDDVEELRRLLMDAEATVLARLAASGEGT